LALLPIGSIVDSISSRSLSGFWWQLRSVGRTRRARFEWWLKFIANQVFLYPPKFVTEKRLF
jgi:hypothetical protein